MTETRGLKKYIIFVYKCNIEISWNKSLEMFIYDYLQFNFIKKRVSQWHFKIKLYSRYLRPTCVKLLTDTSLPCNGQNEVRNVFNLIFKFFNIFYQKRLQKKLSVWYNYRKNNFK